MITNNTAATAAKNRIRFNVRNAKYAFPTQSGYGAFESLGTSTKIALDTDTAEKKVYGDGECIIHYVNEKGKTGTLTLNNVCDAYEIANGRKVLTTEGLADIKPTKNTPHVIYFETCAMDGDNAISVAKTMLFGVTTTRPSESYDQTTDDINESSFDLPLAIAGVPILAADGKVYKDAKGNEVRVWSVTKTPDMDGYDTFGDAVVIPKMPAASGV